MAKTPVSRTAGGPGELRRGRFSARECALAMNRSVWNVRRRHEWLATPLKGKPMKKRKRLRVGLEQARARKAAAATPAEAPAA
jgi:hypothetical protein